MCHQVFQASTIAELGAVVDGIIARGADTLQGPSMVLQPVPEGVKQLPLSYQQEQMLVLYNLAEDKTSYNRCASNHARRAVSLYFFLHGTLFDKSPV